MDDTRLRTYRTQLEEEKARLIKEMEKESVPEDFGSDVDDFDEEKNEAEQLGNRLAVRQALAGRANEIDAALNRMREGKYGTCEKCGDVIGKDVLATAPESRLCARCKKSQP